MTMGAKLVGLISSKTENLAGHGRTDVGTHDHGHSLSKFHNTGVYEADQHNGRRRRALDHAGHDRSQCQSLEPVVGQTLQCPLQPGTGQLFQRSAKEAHSI